MQFKLLLIAGGAALGLATSAAAQMDHSNMPGMKMPPPKTTTVKKPAPKKPAAAKPAARKKSVKPAARSIPRAKAGSGARPAASRSAKPSAPGTVVADPHAGHDMTAMPGMNTPEANPNPGAGHDMSAMPDTSGGAAPGQPSAMQGMDHGSMQGMDQGSGAMQGMAGHDMGSMSPPTTGTTMVGTNLPAGNAPPPPIPTDRAADQVYSAAAMAHSQQHLQMHGDRISRRSYSTWLKSRSGMDAIVIGGTVVPGMGAISTGWCSRPRAKGISGAAWKQRRCRRFIRAP